MYTYIYIFSLLSSCINYVIRILSKLQETAYIENYWIAGDYGNSINLFK